MIETILERIAVSLEKLAALANASANTPVEHVVAAKPRTKAAPAPVVAVTPPAATEPDIFGDEPQAPVVPAATKDDVRKAMVAYQKRTTPTKAQELLAAFGAATLGALAVDKYAEVIAKANAS